MTEFLPLHPLTGPLEKLRRTEAHIHDLDTQIETFLRSSKHKIVVAEMDACGEYYALRAAVSASPPTGWGAIVGEIAHNLRSALDGLMWQLIILNGLDPESLQPRGPLPAFPIFEQFQTATGSGWWNDGRRQVARLKPLHGEWIERLQPYHAKPPHLHPLWLLHELNNTDKHKIIQVTAASFGIMALIGAPTWEKTLEMANKTIWLPDPLFLVDGAYLGKIHGSVLAESDAKYHPEPEMTFQGGCANGRSVTQTLASLWNVVSHVLRGFRGQFPPIPTNLTDGLNTQIRVSTPHMP